MSLPELADPLDRELGPIALEDRQVKGADVHALLDELARRAPWATIGFDPALDEAAVMRRFDEHRAAFARRP